MRPKLLTIAFLASVAVLALVQAGYFVTVRQLEREQGSVVHSSQARFELERLMSTLKDIETGKRGYILTGDLEYLVPYLEALQNLSNYQLSLRDLLGGDPHQRAELDRLGQVAAKRVENIIATLKIFNSQGLAAAQEAIRQNRGKALMDDLRTIVGDLEDTQSALIAQRRDSVERQTVGVTAASIVAGLISLGTLFLVFRWLTRENRRRLQAERVLSEINAGLETRVEERTAALAAANARLEGEVEKRAQIEAALKTALVAAESAAKAKAAFLANASHELRTPLNAILGFSEVIRDQLAGPIGTPAYGEYAGHIFTGGQTLLSAIDDILAFAKQESIRAAAPFEAFDLTATIEACVARAPAAAAQVKLRFRTAAQAQAFLGEETAIARALDALLSNAVKFNRPGGRADIDLISAPDGSLRIVVADTGIGIPEAELEQAVAALTQLDQSMTRRYEGLGLGLPIAKLVAESHGGRLLIASVPGEGTRVEIALPAERVPRFRQLTARAKPAAA